VRTKVNWILDADIRSFFETVSHEWLMRFLEHRTATSGYYASSISGFEPAYWKVAWSRQRRGELRKARDLAAAGESETREVR